MTEQAMKFRLGLFVLASLLLLAVLMIMFGSFPSFLFKKPNVYSIYFNDATGVGVGTPVRRSGIRIGEVTGIALVDDSRGSVKVTVAIDPKYTIWTDDTPTIVYSVLGGDTSIDFIPHMGRAELAGLLRVAQTGHEPVQPGAELKGERQKDIMTMLAQVVPNTEKTLQEMQKAIEKMETLVPTTNQTLKDFDRLSKNSDVLVTEMRQTNKEINQLAAQTRTLVPEIKKTSDEMQVASRNISKVAERVDVLIATNQETLNKIVQNMNDTLVRIGSFFSDENQRNATTFLKNVKNGTNNLERISKETEGFLKDSRALERHMDSSLQQADVLLKSLNATAQPFAERGPRTMKNLDEGAEKLNRSMDDIRTLTTAAVQSNGTLGRLLNDPSLYNHLDEAACILAKLMPKVQWILKDVEVFSDKIARHPELIGLGGAVRSSSGLKDSFGLTPASVPHQ